MNNTSEIVPAAVPGAAHPFQLSGSTVAWLTVAVSWIVAAILLVLMQRADRHDVASRAA